MPKLSDTQLVILNAACQRDDRCVFPVTSKLKGNAVGNILKSLLIKGLLQEVPGRMDDTIWRQTDDGPLTLRATDAAFAALGIEAPTEETQMTSDPVKSTKAPKKTPVDAKKPPKEKVKAKREKSKPVADRPRATRGDSKQAQLIAMLKRAKGASIDEIVEAMNWQPHTVRGVIAGALKKKLGLDVTSDKDEKRGRVYHITP